MPCNRAILLSLLIALCVIHAGCKDSSKTPAAKKKAGADKPASTEPGLDDLTNPSDPFVTAAAATSAADKATTDTHSPDLVLATIERKGDPKPTNLTLEWLSHWEASRAKLGDRSDPMQKLNRLPIRSLVNMASASIAQRGAAEIFRETHPETPAELATLQLGARAEEISFAIARKGLESAPPISDEEALAHYKENQAYYTVPFQFHMRHLSIRKYAPYISMEGDTLESIAEKHSKSAAAVANILTDAAGKMPRWVPLNERDVRPFKPLEPGERLLLPMPEEEIAEMRKLITEQILPKIKKPEDFETICAMYSDAEDKGGVIGPLPFGMTPMHKELIEAAKTTPLGEVSGIVETPHALEIIQVTERKDERLLEFDEVKERIKAELKDVAGIKRADEQKKEIEAVVETMGPVLMDAGSAPDAVAVRIGAKTWTREQTLKMIEEAGRARIFADEQSAREEVLKLDVIRNHAIIAFGEKSGLTSDPSLSERIAFRLDGLAAQYAVQLAQRDAVEALDEKAFQDWYRKNIVLFTPPLQFHILQIVAPIARVAPDANLDDPKSRGDAEKKALDRLASATRGVKNENDFLEARADIDKVTEYKGYASEVAGNLASKFNEQLPSLKEGKPSQPFVLGESAYVLFPKSIVKSDPAPYDAVKTQVQARAKQSVALEVQERMRRESVERFQFKPVAR